MIEIRVHDIINEEILAVYKTNVCPRMGEQMVINGESYRVATVDHYVEVTTKGGALKLIEVGVLYNV